ncbi:maleate cis-trans isomerase family protein [Hoeflea poritis]|uniref:Aspartate/glutamate racemase family protein n=1 Tax=Hoeflea poritis TaxID=2993659 RepID=A0ABT4VT03_9HYPH|nr:aspartate/glutamate racemase family protein [Hoeflea poritis]MDA4847843.1 aspartate/glutamate racemase family protein [Hoeflea poritis]
MSEQKKITSGPYRVGLILPSINTLTEPEFYRAVVSGVTFHSARIFMAETSIDDLETMNRSVGEACKLLSSTTPDLVVYACTSGSFVAGTDGLNALITKINTATGCPAVATSHAMLAALSQCGATEVALVTPYLDEVTNSEEAFLRDNGLDVVYSKGLGRSGKDVRPTPVSDVENLVEEASHTAAEVIFVSCTDLDSFRHVGRWEKQFGKQILTSNQVTLWQTLKNLEPDHRPGNSISIFDWVQEQRLFQFG